MNINRPELTETVVRLLKKSRSVLFVTGAGISADSGIPTYRGIGGLYDVDVTDEGFPIEDVLSGSMMEARPELTWKYLAQIGEAARGAKPNRAHEVIADFERTLSRVWTLTQNVDGFHMHAGSENVIEIHGNMRSLSCMSCSHQLDIDESTSLDIPPHCSRCNGFLRPDVVLFGEELPEQAMIQLRRELETGFSLVIAVGTSGLFPYIQEPFLQARMRGVPTVEINPEETMLSHSVDYRIELGAAEALEEIWRRFTQG